MDFLSQNIHHWNFMGLSFIDESPDNIIGQLYITKESENLKGLFFEGGWMYFRFIDIILVENDE